MSTIGSNVAALKSLHNLRLNEDGFAKATERLSSGKRINSAGDDAAGATTTNDRNATLYVRQSNAQKGMAIRSVNSGTDMIELWSNKLDAGDPEQILLESPDNETVLVVRFSDVKSCLDNAFGEL